MLKNLSNSKKPEIEYYPNKLCSQNAWGSIALLWNTLLKSRELIWRLFMRDFLTKYKQSFLGILWAIIIPVVSIIFFILLNKTGIVNIGATKIPYVLFALMGVSVWQLFSQILLNCSNSLVQAGGMIVKINFPKSALIFAAVGQPLVEFLIRIIMLVAAMIYYRVTPASTIIFVPLILASLIVFSVALGLVSSIIVGITRDLQNILSIFINFAMFITPVLYPVNKNQLFQKINQYNPLSYFVNAIRDYWFKGTYDHCPELWIVAVLSGLLFLVCWRVFVLAEAKIAERI